MQTLLMNYTIPTTLIPTTLHLFSNTFNTMRYNLTPQVPNLKPYTFFLTPHALRYNLTPQVPNLEPYTLHLTPRA